MDDDLTSTVRLVRRPRVVTNDVGGTVWVDEVEPVEIELVSTMMLKVMLDADEDGTRQQLQDAAASGNGMLAHDPKRASFEVIDDEELRAALAGTDDPFASSGKTSQSHYEITEAADEVEGLSLVSTQMIKVMLEHPELSPEEVSDELQLIEEINASGGFDPYNKG